jgi:hypothetical protein
VGSPAVAANSILDYSGNNLHGTPANGPVYSSDVSPWSSTMGSTRSLSYNGSNNRVSIPDSSNFQLTHSLTIEAVFKTESMVPGTGASANLLFRGDNRPGLDPYRLSLSQPGNGLYFQIQDANQQAVALSYTVPFGQWVFAAGTLDDATGLMSLYVNGNLVASTTTSIRPMGGLNPSYSPGLGIGSDQGAQYGELFHGSIDEVRLSDKALNPSEFLIVPEPSSFALCSLAAAIIAIVRRAKP